MRWALLLRALIVGAALPVLTFAQARPSQESPAELAAAAPQAPAEPQAAEPKEAAPAPPKRPPPPPPATTTSTTPAPPPPPPQQPKVVTLTLVEVEAAAEAAKIARHQALWRAASESVLEEAKELVKAGADPNYQDMHGWTTLTMAALNNASTVVEMTQFLIASRADPDIQDRRGRTALYHAVHLKNLALVKELLKTAKHVDPHDGHQQSALLLATRSDSHLIVEELLKAGADPLKGDCHGGHSLQHAGKHGDHNMRRLHGLGEKAAAVHVKAAPSSATERPQAAAPAAGPGGLRVALAAADIE